MRPRGIRASPFPLQALRAQYLKLVKLKGLVKIFIDYKEGCGGTEEALQPGYKADRPCKAFRIMPETSVCEQLQLCPKQECSLSGYPTLQGVDLRTFHRREKAKAILRGSGRGCPRRNRSVHLDKSQ